MNCGGRCNSVMLCIRTQLRGHRDGVLHREGLKATAPRYIEDNGGTPAKKMDLLELSHKGGIDRADFLREALKKCWCEP